MATEGSVRDWWERVAPPLLHARLKAHQAEGVKPGPSRISKTADPSNSDFMLDRMVSSGVRLPTSGKEEELLATRRAAHKLKSDLAQLPKEGVLLPPRQPPFAAGAEARSCEEKCPERSPSLLRGFPVPAPVSSSNTARTMAAHPADSSSTHCRHCQKLASSCPHLLLSCNLACSGERNHCCHAARVWPDALSQCALLCVLRSSRPLADPRSTLECGGPSNSPYSRTRNSSCPLTHCTTPQQR